MQFHAICSIDSQNLAYNSLPLVNRDSSSSFRDRLINSRAIRCHEKERLAFSTNYASFSGSVANLIKSFARLAMSAEDRSLREIDRLAAKLKQIAKLNTLFGYKLNASANEILLQLTRSSNNNISQTVYKLQRTTNNKQELNFHKHAKLFSKNSNFLRNLTREIRSME